jgi:hypothetical protein
VEEKSVTVRFGKIHGVNMNPSEEGSRNQNCQRDEDLAGLSNLTLVASLCVPTDILVEIWSPKSV